MKPPHHAHGRRYQMPIASTKSSIANATYMVCQRGGNISGVLITATPEMTAAAARNTATSFSTSDAPGRSADGFSGVISPGVVRARVMTSESQATSLRANHFPRTINPMPAAGNSNAKSGADVGVPFGRVKIACEEGYREQRRHREPDQHEDSGGHWYREVTGEDRASIPCLEVPGEERFERVSHHGDDALQAHLVGRHFADGLRLAHGQAPAACDCGEVLDYSGMV